jgi:hypothetical protein
MITGPARATSIIRGQIRLAISTFTVRHVTTASVAAVPIVEATVITSIAVTPWLLVTCVVVSVILFIVAVIVVIIVTVVAVSVIIIPLVVVIVPIVAWFTIVNILLPWTAVDVNVMTLAIDDDRTVYLGVAQTLMRARRSVCIVVTVWLGRSSHPTLRG